MKENLVYLQRRIEQSLEEKYAIPMQQFTEIELFLHPNGVLQERVYTPLYFLNEYGFAWIEKLNQLEVPYSRSEEHTSELQSRFDLVCRLLLEKKNECMITSMYI